jgi:hypothetical protein
MTAKASKTLKVQPLKASSETASNSERVVLKKLGDQGTEVIAASKSKPLASSLAKILVFEKDLASPLGGELWDVCKSTND